MLRLSCLPIRAGGRCVCERLCASRLCVRLGAAAARASHRLRRAHRARRRGRAHAHARAQGRGRQTCLRTSRRCIAYPFLPMSMDAAS
eukprot:1031879-Pleurochrysis_carterae.AAC.1